GSRRGPASFYSQPGTLTPNRPPGTKQKSPPPRRTDPGMTHCRANGSSRRGTSQGPDTRPFSRVVSDPPEQSALISNRKTRIIIQIGFISPLLRELSLVFAKNFNRSGPWSSNKPILLNRSLFYSFLLHSRIEKKQFLNSRAW